MLTNKAAAFVTDVETLIERKIDYVGFGPEFLKANRQNMRCMKTV